LNPKSLTQVLKSQALVIYYVKPLVRGLLRHIVHELINMRPQHFQKLQARLRHEHQLWRGRGGGGVRAAKNTLQGLSVDGLAYVEAKTPESVGPEELCK
jgi:hypothetical protein